MASMSTKLLRHIGEVKKQQNNGSKNSYTFSTNTSFKATMPRYPV